MLVILEGADGSGKTSLSHLLRKELGEYTWLLRSNGPPTNVVDMTRTVEWLTRKIPPRVNIVCDRFPMISEMVYGPILRGKCMHAFTVAQVAQYLRTGVAPTILIYCRPRKPDPDGDQLEGVVENLGRIVDAYDNLMNALEGYGLTIFRYDYHFESARASITETVEQFFRGELRG